MLLSVPTYELASRLLEHPSFLMQSSDLDKGDSLLKLTRCKLKIQAVVDFQATLSDPQRASACLMSSPQKGRVRRQCEAGTGRRQVVG